MLEAPLNTILQRLRGTDRRSIGKSNEVAAEVEAQPDLFGLLLEGMLHHDPVIRMRAADAVEKITAQHHEYLRPFKRRLIHEVARIDQQEVRWHAAQMFSRLVLTPKERRAVFSVLLEYLNDRSKIVKTFSIQALADMAMHDSNLRPAVVRFLKPLARAGSPAMRARSRKLLGVLSRRAKSNREI
jgi:hypothetical protein